MIVESCGLCVCDKELTWPNVHARIKKGPEILQQLARVSMTTQYTERSAVLFVERGFVDQRHDYANYINDGQVINGV